jgi:hypothetical protein
MTRVFSRGSGAQIRPNKAPELQRYCVARAGIEPATFRFSGGRSYQLSYLAGTAGTTSPRRVATLTGLEPATSAVTGRRANQLRHRALLLQPPLRTLRVPPTGFEPVLPP